MPKYQNNIVIVGSKCDDQENRRVKADHAKQLCEQLSCLAYFETSALQSINIDEVFYTVTMAALQQAEIEKPRNSVRLHQKPRERAKSDAGADLKNLFDAPKEKKGCC